MFLMVSPLLRFNILVLVFSDIGASHRGGWVSFLNQNRTVRLEP